MSLKKFALLSFVAVLLLGACAAPTATTAPAEDAATAESTAEDAAAAPADAEAATDPEARYAEILQCVEENLPASTYMTNDLLPDPEAAWEPMECETVDKIRVGMPWVLNDEEAPWYNAIEKGYYADVCLEVELVPGGPGVDHLQTLAGGAVDIAVAAGGSRIPAMAYSPTPADVVAIGAFLKHSPYIWMGLDPNTPQDQPSTLELKPEDFIGKKVGLQSGSDYLFDFLVAKYNLPKDQITIMEAGFTPDPLLVGAMDYIGAWIVNQPRLLEEQGYMNWTAFRFSEWGWDGYSDVSAVRRETLEENPDLVKRYLAATYQGAKFLVENPDESADIAVKYGVDAQLTKEQALRRFQLQETLIQDDADPGLLIMSADKWNAEMAAQIQYDQLQVDACK